MPLSPHLVRKLQDALGHEAAQDLVSRLEGGDSLRADVSELRHEMQHGFAAIAAQITVLSANVDARFATADARMDTLDQKIDLKIDGLASTLLAEMKEQVATATAKLLKWSFVFWVGAVGAIAGLAGILK